MISKSHPIPPKIDTKANGKFAGPTNQVFVLIVAGDDAMYVARFGSMTEPRRVSPRGILFIIVSTVS